MANSNKFPPLILLICCLLISQTSIAKEKFKIGFSQCTSVDSWRKAMQTEMQNELILFQNMELIITDADDNNETQIKDIRELVKSGIDLLIVSPNESAPITQIVEEVFRQGIPVIVLDRKIESENYTAQISADNYLIGKEAGRYAAKLLNGKGNIVEIWGLKGSSPAIERHKGFSEVISKYPNIKIIFSETGEWFKQGGTKMMKLAIEQHDDINLVFAHNDYMAIGAYEVLQSNYKTNRPFLLGIDGLPGPNDGVNAVIQKKMNATFLYPTGGAEAIQLAFKILNKKIFKKNIILKTVVIDSDNAEIQKLQTDQILSLQGKISTAKTILDSQIIKYKSQRMWLIISLSFLLILILLAVLLFQAFKNKIKANQKLEEQKEQIEDQHEKLILISAQLEEATQTKLRFFTNVSHEFRTPLTLILGSIENLLDQKIKDKESHQQLNVMHRNANRLLRLINQLMDFRKIENEKMQMKISKNDINQFIKEISDSFQELANKKNINYSYLSTIQKEDLYFDTDKLDKILFNLLSNAFKFTPKQGGIAVHLENSSYKFNSEMKDCVKISVVDSGNGISESDLKNVFQRFYQAKTNASFPGTGVGLSLTKALVELHSGIIDVESSLGKGTTLTVYLQKGKSHFNDADLIFADSKEKDTSRQIPSELDEMDFIPQLTDSNEEENPSFLTDKEIRILIVEDNLDVLEHIAESLKENYKILRAENGKQALKVIEAENPELIITDLMMPVMDGLELTNIVKSDLKTCHIPVIMLTAKASQEHKIEGLEVGADSYIPKPFNKKHLQVRVRKLIESKKRVRIHYRESIDFTEQNDGINRLDQQFLKKACEAIEANYLNYDYGVEELSKDVNLSRVHLYRKIKSLTDLSASEFIRNVKLKKASSLLLESDLSISQIAYQTGFASPSYFSKCFKEKFKISPKEYIQQKK
ncbi:MAG: substrate-binding domain-containing protein [Labilibaculum sp.]|nr:substrate-binding domain-containing protein [Labilibaculum sp.]